MCYMHLTVRLMMQTPVLASATDYTKHLCYSSRMSIFATQISIHFIYTPSLFNLLNFLHLETEYLYFYLFLCVVYLIIYHIFLFISVSCISSIRSECDSLRNLVFLILIAQLKTFQSKYFIFMTFENLQLHLELKRWTHAP